MDGRMVLMTVMAVFMAASAGRGALLCRRLEMEVGGGPRKQRALCGVSALSLCVRVSSGFVLS